MGGGRLCGCVPTGRVLCLIGDEKNRYVACQEVDLAMSSG